MVRIYIMLKAKGLIKKKKRPHADMKLQVQTIWPMRQQNNVADKRPNWF